MSGGIYLVQDEGGLIEMTEQGYEKEDHLQELLANYPNLLAGDQITSGEPRRWLLVSRELALASEEDGAGRWSVDHLFLDQDAIPTIVEVKRSSNTQIRREVVGQMLDYAANAVVYWKAEELHTRFSQSHEDPEEKLSDFLQDPDADLEDFWQRVKMNLEAGRVRLVFVADKIPAGLRQIVEFLNKQMSPAEVLAVEVKQYIGQGMKTLVPRVIGQTEEAQQKKPGVARSGKRWDETLFFDELNSQTPEAVAPAKAILEWAENSVNKVEWGKGVTYGTFNAMLEHRGSMHHLLEVGTKGRLYIQLGYPQAPTLLGEESKRSEVLLRLEEIPGIALSAQTKKNKWPSISLASLNNESTLKQLLETLDWFVQEVKGS